MRIISLGFGIVGIVFGIMGEIDTMWHCICVMWLTGIYIEVSEINKKL